MSGSMKDGGPAFPCEDHYNPRGHFHQTGMSLRDWFAGQALIALGNSIPRHADEDETVGQARARHCYEMADAMLATREKS